MPKRKPWNRKTSTKKRGSKKPTKKPLDWLKEVWKPGPVEFQRDQAARLGEKE